MLVRVLPGPKPKGKWNARNSYFGIRIYADIPCFDAVLAQEVFEFWFRWAVTLLVAVPAFATIALLGAHIVLGVPSLLLGVLLARIRPVLELMELIGHAIESNVAARKYGMHLGDYQEKEAAALSGGSYRDKGLFPGKSVADILRRLRGPFVQKIAGWFS